mgnify:CR=1 FL=1
MKKQTKKGFTLVELVIVIAVIAILSAILIPTFGNVISQAKEKAAQEDARTAYQQFLMDNKDNDIVTSENYTAYILVDAKTESAGPISDATYVYSFADGALKKVQFSEVAVTEANATITIKSDTLTADNAFALSKTGMYIVFKTKPTTSGN